MLNGQFKVTITHLAVSTDYISNRFPSIRVTGRENGVSSGILIGDNRDSSLYPDNLDALDTIQISVKDASDAGWTEIFDGVIRHCNPQLSEKGDMVELKCKGLGAALENTNCNSNFGYASNNASKDTVEEIIEDLVDNYVNKSFGSANNTGYALTKTYIPTIDAGLSISYINSPYNTCQQIIDNVCMIDTAFRNGTTAGPHYFVDVLGNLRVKTIGTQQAEIGPPNGGDWGIYYGGSNNAVNLTQGVDFTSYDITKATDEYANNILLATDLRKPPNDYWTENQSGLWDIAGVGVGVNVALADDNGAGEFVVGTHSLKISGQNGGGTYAWFPAAKNAGWDFTKLESPNNPPRLNFYFKEDDLINAAACEVRLFTTDEDTDYYSVDFNQWGEAHSTWYHRSLPFGQYYRSASESKELRWAPSGGAEDWADINGIAFYFANDVGAVWTDLWVDDLHFSGKLIREAVDLDGEVDPDPPPNKIYQKIIMSRNALDDSMVAADDTGMAGHYAYAELLRRVNLPRTMRCRVPLKKDLKPGENWAIYAGYNGSAHEINGVDFRTIQYTHSIDSDGFNSDLVLSDDVKNSFPVSKHDMRGILNEFLLFNNEQAKNMKSNGEVDLLIPHLRKTY